MRPGVVCHLFWRGQVLLVLRDKGEGFADPDRWDSITETIEDVDLGSFSRAMTRGLLEEISIEVDQIHFLGVTKKGHGFFVGILSDREKHSMFLGEEGQKFDFFTLEQAEALRKNGNLGGAFRNHLEVYPQAFEKLSKGIIPVAEEFGLVSEAHAANM